MNPLQERILKFLKEGLSSGLLTLNDYNALLSVLEESSKVTTIHPKLYAGLLKDSIESFSEMTEEAEKEISKFKTILEDRGLEVKEVVKNEEMWSIKALGADASSYPLPIATAKVALISAIALREETQPMIMRDIVKVKNNVMTSREFKFYYQVQAESLIPVACIRHIEELGKPESVIVDGPLSASGLLINVPYRRGLKPEVYGEIRRKSHQLIRIRDQLIQRCFELGIPVFSVVKRCTSRHFMAWYGLKDICPYTDQFIFQQLLNYGQRTQAISISKAIEKQGAELFARFNEIYGFYIKTSRNPLTPPIRVEYPEYLRGKEDWIASYVLTTSLTTYETEFDGLPKIVCLAHKDSKITKAIMKEIYRRGVIKMLDEGKNIKLLGLIWGYSLE
ncbi:MAG: DNA double-strand break repair nuclease NurA [candidate division WOR-3 bacterium]